MTGVIGEIIAALDADNMRLACELAWWHDITLTEIWSEDDEIIGMMVDDITVYYEEDN